MFGSKDVEHRDADAIIREYHEANYALKIAFAEETVKLAEISDTELRGAKVTLAVPQEVKDRHREATIAFDQLTSENSERWISAHEDLVPFRGGRVQS